MGDGSLGEVAGGTVSSLPGLTLKEVFVQRGISAQPPGQSQRMPGTFQEAGKNKGLLSSAPNVTHQQICSSYKLITKPQVLSVSLHAYLDSIQIWGKRVMQLICFLQDAKVNTDVGQVPLSRIWGSWG